MTPSQSPKDFQDKVQETNQARTTSKSRFSQNPSQSLNQGLTNDFQVKVRSKPERLPSQNPSQSPNQGPRDDFQGK